MDKERITTIKARATAATPPPWAISTGKRGFGIGSTIFEGSESGRVIMYSAEMGATIEQYRADCEFAAHARQDIPDLLTALAELQAENENLVKQLRRYKIR